MVVVVAVTKPDWLFGLAVVFVGILSNLVLAITTVISTNESAVLTAPSVSLPPSTSCLDASVCSCDKANILKCFCQGNAYFLNFQFSDFGTDFDLIQIGDCRQVTFYGLPYSSRPPEILQFFDVSNLFQDRNLSVQPQTTIQGLPSRPIKRIEFLNVTISYLALNDFYALNDVENFIVKDCSIKVLGGRPKSMNFSSNIQRLVILNSLIIEMRKDSLDLQNVQELVIANSTIHLWQPNSVRLTNASHIVITDCHIQNMDENAMTTIFTTEVIFRRNRFHFIFDDAFDQIRDVDFHFVDNVLESPDPRAFGALFANNNIRNFTNNTLPCKEPLCLGPRFLLLRNNYCANRDLLFHQYFISTVLANACPQGASSGSATFLPSVIQGGLFFVLGEIFWFLNHN